MPIAFLAAFDRSKDSPMKLSPDDMKTTVAGSTRGSDGRQGRLSSGCRI
jgi:hypothetical protein